MNCNTCDALIPQGVKFCGECGTPVGVSRGIAVSTGGGDVHGGLYQAGRDVVVNPPMAEPISAHYEAVPKWRSPITQGVLSWAGFIIGFFSLFPLWKLLSPLIELFTKGAIDSAAGNSSLVWIYLWLALLLLLMITLSLRNTTKLQTRKPLAFGWAVSGAARRITLEQIRAGHCPKCGGKMKYYNKPTEFETTTDSNGVRRTKAVTREPALECRRNPKHWFWVDPAEESES